MLFGLGLPEWLTILGLVGGLWLTFRVMARASLAYERRRMGESSGVRGTLDDKGEDERSDDRPDDRPRKEPS